MRGQPGQFTSLSREEIELLAQKNSVRLIESLEMHLSACPRGTRKRVIGHLGVSNSLFGDLKRSKAEAIPIGKILKILSCIDIDPAHFFLDALGETKNPDIERLLLQYNEDVAELPPIVVQSRREGE